MSTKHINKADLQFNNALFFGILGGMGPIASAKFLETVYRYCEAMFNREQDYPRIVLMSDPAIPDRSILLEQKYSTVIAGIFEDKIAQLSCLGIDQIVIACVTAHLYWSELKETTRAKLISLVDLMSNEFAKNDRPILLLSSFAVYESKIIAHPNVICLEENDATALHRYIFKLKIAFNQENCLGFIEFSKLLAQKYQVGLMVFACTELHLINAFIQQYKIAIPYSVIDPLELAARYIIQKHLASIK